MVISRESAVAKLLMISGAPSVDASSTTMYSKSVNVWPRMLSIASARNSCPFRTAVMTETRGTSGGLTAQVRTDRADDLMQRLETVRAVDSANRNGPHQPRESIQLRGGVLRGDDVPAPTMDQQLMEGRSITERLHGHLDARRVTRCQDV